MRRRSHYHNLRMWHASHPAVPAGSGTLPHIPASFPPALPSPVCTVPPGLPPAGSYWNIFQDSYGPAHKSSVCTLLL